MGEFIPEDVSLEILEQLLPKQLIKFKCVSHIWQNMISSDEFVERRLRRMKIDNRFSIMNQVREANPPICYGFVTIAVPSYRRFVRSSDEDYEVLGTYNGLVLFCNTADGYSLVNPSTNETFILPNDPISIPPAFREAWMYFSLGFVSECSAFKIMRIARFWSVQGYQYEVKLYCSKTNMWTFVQSYPYQKPPISNGFFVGGRFHWPVRFDGGVYKLASFDVKHSSYQLIDIPNYIIPTWHVGFRAFDEFSIAAYSSKLSPEVNGVSMYFLQMHILSYRNEGSTWSSFTIFKEEALPFMFDIYPISFINVLKTLILFKEDPSGKFCSYDITNREFRYLDWLEDAPDVDRSYCVLSSLVSPFHKNMWK